jgi:pyrimidine operon attenuation protein/uracil phosphoribosyltransferase
MMFCLGRSIRSALTAIQSFGRPSEIELLVLIDRRFSRNLPIQPDYRGRQVDAINNEKVKVEWSENNGEDVVYLVTRELNLNRKILFYKNKIIVKE